MVATVDRPSKGERIAFLGDSILHGGKLIQVLQLFENLRHPGSGVRYVNLGRSGGSAGAALGILDAELKAGRPDRVIAMFGMNDVARNTYSQTLPRDAGEAKSRKDALDWFRRNITAVVERIKGAGIPVTLMTPTPYDQYSKIETENLLGCNEPGLADVTRIDREIASGMNIPLIDLFEPMTALLKSRNADFAYSRDRVHPDWEGHMIAASLILDAFGDAGAVDETEVGAAEAMAGFSYAPKALPYPKTPEYETVDRLVGFTEKHNREMLKVRGLARGRYGLFGNGILLGEFSADEFASGVNIALLDTPGQRFALSLVPVQRELQATLADYRNVVLIENMLRVEKVDPSDYAVSDCWLDAWLEKQRQSPWYLGVKAWVDGWRNGRGNKTETEALIESLYAKMASVVIPGATFAIRNTSV